MMMLRDHDKNRISIHALREEGDHAPGLHCPGSRYFYPRPPRGGRRLPSGQKYFYLSISIHALREEGDFSTISIEFGSVIFLSTPSARRATFWQITPERALPFLSTPSARRATGSILRGTGPATGFLSTPSARRATQELAHHGGCPKYFYPRPPRGGRPGSCEIDGLTPEISIHALREEGDPRCAKSCRPRTDFYPRPPRGGRPMWPWRRISMIRFLSTPSARRATIHGGQQAL